VSYFSQESSDVMALRDARLIEARSLVRQLAEPRPVGDSVKAAIRRAGWKLRHWSQSRVHSVWYGDRRARIGADEIDTLRQLTARQKTDRSAAHDLEELHRRIVRLETLLRISHPKRLGADSVVVRQNRRDVQRALGVRHRSEPQGAR
jgi:hypothetical protein